MLLETGAFFAGVEHPLADNGHGDREAVLDRVAADRLNEAAATADGVLVVRLDVTALLTPGLVHHPSVIQISKGKQKRKKKKREV